MSSHILYNGIRYDHLNSISINNSYVKQQAIELLRCIDDKIMLSFSNEEEKLIYHLPIRFDIPNLKNKDSQLLIYYLVVTNLKYRGFKNIQLDFKEDYVSLIIELKNNIDYSKQTFLYW